MQIIPGELHQLPLRAQETSVEATSTCFDQRSNKAMSPIGYISSHLHCRSCIADACGDLSVRTSHAVSLNSTLLTRDVPRYYHRPINTPKLVDINFYPVPRNQTLARMIRLHKLPSAPHLAGLREMQEEDLQQVADLYARYMQRYDLIQAMTLEETRHHFLSGLGRGTVHPRDGRRDGQVIWSYVVEVSIIPAG
jgi:hypothetical protein